MGSAPTEKMVIPSKIDEVPRVQQAVRQAVEQAGYDEQAMFGIRLALEEALSNAIRHGNAGDPEKQVPIEYQIDPHRIYIQVCDEGNGFNAESLPDPTAEENITRPHGRGVMLMQAYMSEVRYNEAGNCVTMIRHTETDEA